MCAVPDNNIGWLPNEIESIKFKDSDFHKFLRKAPDIKDVEIKEKLDKLKLFNDVKQLSNSGNNNDNHMKTLTVTFHRFFLSRPPPPPPPCPFIPDLLPIFIVASISS